MIRLRQFIASKIGFPLQDIYNGTNIVETMHFLNKSQYWDEYKIMNYRLKKLKLLIDHAKTNVPYYEKLFNKKKKFIKEVIYYKPRDIHGYTASINYLNQTGIKKNLGIKNDVIALGNPARAMKNNENQRVFS